MTRGEMASFLARALDLPAGTARFGDVAPTSSRSRAVGAVSTAGIAAGFDDGTFRPGDPIPRAQMASLLHRASLVG